MLLDCVVYDALCRLSLRRRYTVYVHLLITVQKTRKNILSSFSHLP
jgi:hypothetical protein